MRVRVEVQVAKVTLINSELELLEVTQTLGEHTRCVVEFIRDRSTDLTLESLLEGPVTVMLRDDGGDVTAFDGEVVSGSQEHYIHAGSRFHIEAASRSSAWDEHVNTAVFPAATLPDVVRRLGGSVAGSVPGGTAMTLVQHAESEFQFIKRLAAENGCFVRPTANAFEVRAGFDAKVAELRWGDTLTRARASTRLVNPGFKGAATQETDFRDHRLHAVRKQPATLGGAASLLQALRRFATKVQGGGDPGYLAEQRRAPTIAAFRKVVERNSERKATEALFVEGSSVEIRLRAGDQCTLLGSDVFELPTDGVFGITRVTHRFSGQLYANDFELTPWASFAPAPRSVPSVPGLVTAVVTANHDPEGRGRVRVRFAWMNDGEKSRWLPIVVPYAGNNRGMQWLPEIGDQVVVSFEQGDPERPIVLGGLWNGKALAKQVEGVKRLVSKSGHSVVFDDREGKESIEIFSATGACLVALHNAGTPTITIHSEGDLSLEAKGQLRIKAGSLVEQVNGATHREAGTDLAMVAKGKMVLGAGTDLLMDAGMNLRAGGGMVAEVQGGMVTQIVGGMVQIQPPGGPRTQKGHASAPSTPASVWTKQQVPEKVEGATSADNPTPRSGGGGGLR